MSKFISIGIVFLFVACSFQQTELKLWEAYDETAEINANANHPVERMRYKRIQSQHSDRNTFFAPFKKIFCGLQKKSTMG